MLHYMGTFYLKKIAESRVPQGFSYFNGSKFGLVCSRLHQDMAFLENLFPLCAVPNVVAME